MALPSINNATFSIKVSELPKPIKIRPMIVSEHKAIQQATDIGNEDDIANTIAEVTSACTNGVVNGTNVPQYLIDFVFLQLYMASVENVISSKYRCYGQLKDENGEFLTNPDNGEILICDSSIDVNLPLSNASILYPEGHSEAKVIKLDESNTLVLKNLSLDHNIDINSYREKIVALSNDLVLIGNSTEDEEYKKSEIEIITDKMKNLKSEAELKYLFYSVDHIVSGESKLLPSIDFTFEEFCTWINNTPSNVMANIDKFYELTPQVGLDLQIKCPHCGNKADIKLRGLSDFFI